MVVVPCDDIQARDLPLQYGGCWMRTRCWGHKIPGSRWNTDPILEDIMVPNKFECLETVDLVFWGRPMEGEGLQLFISRKKQNEIGLTPASLLLHVFPFSVKVHHCHSPLLALWREPFKCYSWRRLFSFYSTSSSVTRMNNGDFSPRAVSQPQSECQNKGQLSC